jgi:hypothetical protein
MTKIWSAIVAILTAITGALFIRNRYVEDKNEKLESEIKVKDKKEEIRKDQGKARTEILEDEKRRIKDADTSGYTADDLNKL